MTTSSARRRPIARSAFVPPVRPLPVRRGSGAPVRRATTMPNGIEPATYDRSVSTTATTISPVLNAHAPPGDAGSVRRMAPESSTELPGRGPSRGPRWPADRERRRRSARRTGYGRVRARRRDVDAALAEPLDVEGPGVMNLLTVIRLTRSAACSIPSLRPSTDRPSALTNPPTSSRQARATPTRCWTSSGRDTDIDPLRRAVRPPHRVVGDDPVADEPEMLAYALLANEIRERAPRAAVRRMR